MIKLLFESPGKNSGVSKRSIISAKLTPDIEMHLWDLFSSTVRSLDKALNRQSRQKRKSLSIH